MICKRQTKWELRNLFQTSEKLVNLAPNSNFEKCVIESAIGKRESLKTITPKNHNNFVMLF